MTDANNPTDPEADDGPMDGGTEAGRSDGRTGDQPRRLISRRGFVAGTSALGITALAAYGIGRRSGTSANGSASGTDGDSGSDGAAGSDGASDSAGTGETTAGSTAGGDGVVVEYPDGESWGDRYSDDEGDVVIDSAIVLDRDVRVTSLTVQPTGSLAMAPDTSVTLVSTGNVIVEGRLRMQPADAGRIHTIRFDNVDESIFVGGGMTVPETDVGLWIVQDGVLEAHGAAKNAWTRTTGDLAAGATTLTVEDPSGWQVGDRLAVTPTIAPSIDNGKFHQEGANAEAYDQETITSIDGGEITVDRELEFDHPRISFTRWDGTDQTLGAEVLNLTRNVVIAGTETGRGHVLFLHCNSPQNLSSVQFDQLGPRKEAGKSQDGEKTRTEGVTGRYPFHMHHCGDGVQGSVIKDCLVTNSGNRAFVPHESHGVTLDRCVAHDVHGTAFWWDMPGRHNPTGEKPKTHDSLWTGCVASKVWADQLSENGYRLAGFNLSDGDHLSNVLVDSVAVGISVPRVTKNTSAPSGFHWTEHGHAVWEFKNCLAHNVAGNGILSWQNDEEVHVIEDFTAYHCASHGIEHGAYSNFYSYQGLTLVGNRLSGIGCHAVTRRTNSVRRAWTDKGLEAPIIEFKDVRIDGRGITVDGIRGLSHRFAASQPDGPTLFENVSVEGCTRAGLFEGDGKNAAYYVLRNWQVDGVEPVMLDQGVPAETRIDVVNLNGSSDQFTLTA